MNPPWIAYLCRTKRRAGLGQSSACLAAKQTCRLERNLWLAVRIRVLRLGAGSIQPSEWRSGSQLRLLLRLAEEGRLTVCWLLLWLLGLAKHPTHSQ